MGPFQSQPQAANGMCKTADCWWRHLWQNNWEILQLPFAQQYCYNTHAEEHILVNEELLANPLVPTFWYALTTSLYGSPRLASLCSSTRVFGSQVHGIWLCNISAIYSQKNITWEASPQVGGRGRRCMTIVVLKYTGAGVKASILHMTLNEVHGCWSEGLPGSQVH